MLVSHGAPSSCDSDDELACVGNDFAAAKEYEVSHRIGGGTFGEVVRARHKVSGRIVALKRVWDNSGGSGGGSTGRNTDCLLALPAALLREPQALQTVRHANVVQLHRTFKLRSSLAMEMECCATDVSMLLRAARAAGAPPPEATARCLLRQLLAALAACHAAGVLHRDVKPGNMLLREDGSLALADFGQARWCTARAADTLAGETTTVSHTAAAATAPVAATVPRQTDSCVAAAAGADLHGTAGAGVSGKTAAAPPATQDSVPARAGEPDVNGGSHSTAAYNGDAGGYTPAVGSRWYRAPELLLGCRSYDGAVDVWAAGCTFAELIGGRPLLPGESDLDQLGRVAQLFGGLSPRMWPGIAAAPDFGKLRFRPVPVVPLERLLPRAPPAAVALLRCMLHLDAGQRPSAAEALRHPYFATSGDVGAAAEAALLQEQVQHAVAYAEAERRRQEAELAAFERELSAML